MGRLYLEVRKHSKEHFYWEIEWKKTQGMTKTVMGGRGKKDVTEISEETSIKDSEDRD